jgi:hypothetical protein
VSEEDSEPPVSDEISEREISVAEYSMAKGTSYAFHDYNPSSVLCQYELTSLAFASASPKSFSIAILLWPTLSFVVSKTGFT